MASISLNFSGAQYPMGFDPFDEDASSGKQYIGVSSKDSSGA